MPAVGDEIVPTDFDALLNSWTDYTPTWNASTTPSIGNGSLLGRYRQVGKTVDFYMQLTFGSTTNGATGTWLFNLPVIGAYSTNPGYTFSATAIDASTTNRYVIGCQLDNVNRVSCFISGGTVLLGTTSPGNGPFTWATNDNLRIAGTYELA